MITNQGQIAATSNVTINGGGMLTLVGTNTLNSLTFNNTGGTATPTVAVGTLLNLTSATPSPSRTTTPAPPRPSPAPPSTSATPAARPSHLAACRPTT